MFENKGEIEKDLDALISDVGSKSGFVKQAINNGKHASNENELRSAFGEFERAINHEDLNKWVEDLNKLKDHIKNIREAIDEQL